MAKRHNESMGQDREETNESENYERNKKVMRGHAQDSRFDEGSTHGPESAKIVRPSTGGYAKGQFFKYLGK
jgi:hypothetical protein